MTSLRDDLAENLSKFYLMFFKERKMRREHKKKLIVNRRIIVNHLMDVEGVLDYLIAKQILTPSMRERIVYENRIPSDRVRQLLDCFITRNALAYQYFLESLVLTGNSHVANILEPEYSASETCRLMIEREKIILPTSHSPAAATYTGLATPPFQNNNQHHVLSEWQQEVTHPAENKLSEFDYNSNCQQNHNAKSSINNNNSNQNSFIYSSTATPLSFQRLIRHNHLSHFQNQCLLSNKSSNGHFNSSCFNRNNSGNFSNLSSENTSRSSSQSQSMSPTTNRTRSNSVNAFHSNNTNNNNNRSSLIGNSRSAGFISSNGNSIEEDIGSNTLTNQASPTSTPIAVSNFCDNDKWSPSNFYTSNLPQTYNIDWSHVNGLELDFQVYKTLPSIRKQLGPDECYQMERIPRGMCLIINNEHFQDQNGSEISHLRRYGTDLDASRLKNLFEKLNFLVEMCVDLTEREMRHKISWFASESDSKSHIHDALCLIVLSHGTDGYVYGVDFENKINIDKDILNTFDDVMIGKPKLFLFQACRGEHLNQKGSSQSSSTITNITQSTLSSYTFSKGNNQIPQQQQQQQQQKQASTITSNNQNGNSIEEDTIKKFKQLKMSSVNAGGIQLMYKKNKSSSSSSSSASSTHSNSSKMKTRSRSHSRGKYSSYLASAASVIRTAIKSTTQSSSSISTQTSLAVQQPSLIEETLTANCYPDTNIITSTNCNLSLMNFIDGRPIKTWLPSRSDFFIWYSSVRGFVSHRDQDGSPFIKCLVTVFSRCAYELELIEMVRKVNMLMQQYERKHFDERNAVASYFMVPVAEFHLTKRLYFNP